MSRFLLDEQIVFDEDNFLLQSVHDEDTEAMRLGAIASSCLAQLVRARGAVVRKRDLMEGAWGQFGLEVTDNSLAQVVRQLRLALEKLQPGREYIITLPRIGYKLSDGVPLQEIGDDGDTPLAATGVAAAPLLTESDERVGTPSSIQAEVAQPAPVLDSARPAPVCDPSRGAASSKAIPWLQGGVIGLLCLASFFMAAHWQQRTVAVESLAFMPPLARPGLLIHWTDRRSVPADEQLETWVEQARQVAALERLSTTELHLYLLGRDEFMGVICDAPLQDSTSHCVGGYAHAPAH